jgi:hypothetical protein
MVNNDIRTRCESILKDYIIILSNLQWMAFNKINKRAKMIKRKLRFLWVTGLMGYSFEQHLTKENLVPN